VLWSSAALAAGFGLVVLAGAVVAGFLTVSFLWSWLCPSCWAMAVLVMNKVAKANKTVFIVV
jgi:hypothetical protein